jgi:hypothetical protein
VGEYATGVAVGDVRPRLAGSRGAGKEQVIPRLDDGPRDRVCHFLCTLTSLLTDSGIMVES